MPRHVASIKCGSCKERHTTVAQVALCYAAKRAATEQTAREEFDAQVARQADEAQLMQELIAERDESGDPAAAAMADAMTMPYAPHFHPGEFDECRIDHRAEEAADVEIALRKAATLALLERWKAANPGRQINGYGCVPYSRCNCPVSYRKCSAFAVLSRFRATDLVARVQAYEPRGFSLGGTRRRQPW